MAIPTEVSNWVEIPVPQEIWKMLVMKRAVAFRVNVGGRRVGVFSTADRLACLDANCYHAGGPLEKCNITDIEEILGQPCVKCPTHKYLISLTSGESFYQSVTFDSTMKPVVGEWVSKGVKQRCHEIRLAGEGTIQIKLSSLSSLESDHFAHMNFSEQAG
eukprot:GHVN01004626.1.p1 GENE.GHVN01004626.1~~GHVN01004626.1.p1  ORF type:complete len:160 (+),score=31.18 GHVN01004626.1:223-702(+)